MRKADFFKNIEKQDDCLIWTGATANIGNKEYPIYKGIYAHRLMFQLYRGIIKGTIRRLCGDSLCVNPKHLAYTGEAPCTMCGENERAINRKTGKLYGECLVCRRKRDAKYYKKKRATKIKAR